MGKDLGHVLGSATQLRMLGLQQRPIVHRSLVESLPTASLLLLVTYRPEYQHGWGHKTYYTQLRLDPLPCEHVQALLAALLGDEGSLAPLKQRVLVRTQGNPFFVEESVQSLIETGGVVGEPGAYRLGTPSQTLQVPATVQAVLAHLPDSRAATEQAIDLRLGLRAALAALGDAPGLMLDHLYRAALLAQALGDQLRLGRIYTEMAGTCWVAGDMDRAIAYGQRALAVGARAWRPAGLGASQSGSDLIRPGRLSTGHRKSAAECGDAPGRAAL